MTNKIICTLVSKGGRTRTGNDKKGSSIHAIAELPKNVFWSTPAMCGAKPNKKSYGWLEINQDDCKEPNCIKCKKLYYDTQT